MQESIINIWYYKNKLFWYFIYDQINIIICFQNQRLERRRVMSNNTNTATGSAKVSNSSAIKNVVLAAAFAALTLLATSVLKIPTPTMGYIHIGDTFVILSGIFLGPLLGGLAAGIGSGLSDLLGGYPVWAPGTFVIKFLTAMVAAFVFKAFEKAAASKNKKLFVAAVPISGVIGEIVMVIGYFFYNIIMMIFANGGASDVTFAAAAVESAAEIPFNLVQAAVGIVLSTILYPIIKKAMNAFTR